MYIERVGENQYFGEKGGFLKNTLIYIFITPNKNLLIHVIADHQLKIIWECFREGKNSPTLICSISN